MESTRKTMIRVAQLVLRGQHGRACREWARKFKQGTPRMLSSKEEREAWARKQLGLGEPRGGA
jgi:hypothetical protein